MNSVNTAARSVHVIVNPDSGSGQVSLDSLKEKFEVTELDWHIHVTGNVEEARLRAAQAVEKKVDVLVACGGDGTISEIAQVLINTDTALGIIPGGTANVLAGELGVPGDIAEAISLVTKEEPAIRKIDVGQIGDKYFFLRVGIGLEAAMTMTTREELKKKMGKWSYLFNAFRIKDRLPKVKYTIEVDGVKHSAHGITCMICNTANVGLQDIQLINAIDIADGLLHVVVVKNSDMKTIASLGRQVLSNFLSDARKTRLSENILYWHGKEVIVSSKPEQLIARDGEPVRGGEPVKATVVPAGLSVIVPESTSMNN